MSGGCTHVGMVIELEVRATVVTTAYVGCCVKHDGWLSRPQAGSHLNNLSLTE